MKSSTLFISLLLFTISMLALGKSSNAQVTINTVRNFSGVGGLDGSLDDADGIANGIFTVSGNLTIICGGSIVCNDPALPAGAGACPIKINVTGDFEMQAGSSIYAENRVDIGNGGNIEISVTGKVTMWGPSAFPCNIGAIISSSNLSATDGNKNAGAITIHAGGNIDLKDGSWVKANSLKGTGGTIEITGGNLVDVDGNVLSQSTGTGAGNNQGHGGLITIIGKCSLEISNTGIVSSKGLDPGADRVHLEACTINIYGLVESTGAGHAIPSNPPNHLNSTYRPDKDPNSTAGVEVWGDVITIDNTNGHNGEINADLPLGAAGKSWIDVFARHNINVISSTGDWAIHANVGGGGGRGGRVNVKSIEGSVNATGKFIQANSTGSNFRRGGDDTVHAKLDLNLVGAKIEAKGANLGGTIALRSFGTGPSTGSINVDATTNLDVTVLGAVTETACGTVGVATIVGSVAVVPVHACGGNPLLPLEIVSGDGNSYVKLPVCTGGGGTTNTCRNCVGEIDVLQNVTLNFNPVTPTCSGDAGLCALFTWDKSGGATADKWKAIFNLGAKKLVVKPGVTITVSTVNGYAPGIEINTTCDVQVDEGAHIVVNSNNKNAGDIVINTGGHIIVNGEIRNEVSGTLGLPGAITLRSKCGDITEGNHGIIQILGVDPGGNTITLLTCGQGTRDEPPPCEQRIGNSPLVQNGDITINGLVKSFAHAHVPPLSEHRPNIRVVSLSGKVTINSNANGGEPEFDEFSQGGGKYDLFGGLLSWVSNNVTPGSVWVLARGNVEVHGHGDDATGPVRKSFGAIAAIATASDGPGGLVDVRSLDGSISAFDRSFDISGNHTYGGYMADSIILYAKLDISLSRPGNNSSNPVVDAHGINGVGGTNEIRSYLGGINVGPNALVSATAATPGVNDFTYCTSLVNNGTIDPAATTANLCSPTSPLPSFHPKFDFESFIAYCNGAGGVIASMVRDLPAGKTVLFNSYPNPFNQSTNISYTLAKSERVYLKVYNMDGKEVATLANGIQQEAGNYLVQFNGATQSGGVYFVRMQAGSYIGTVKMVLAK